MQIHDLKNFGDQKKKKTRVGRGGKRGTTSGKGQKGQKSRAGRRIRPAVRDYIQRLPKRRGHRNSRPPFIVADISLDRLESLNQKIISLAVLKEAGVVKRNVNTVKILSTGRIKNPIQIQGLKITASAKKKIEAAGGTIK